MQTPTGISLVIQLRCRRVVMHPGTLRFVSVGTFLSGLCALVTAASAQPTAATPRGCQPPLKWRGGTCVESCPAGYRDMGRRCEPMRAVSAGEYCVPPPKTASGAWVGSRPRGLGDTGG